jgi:hypothetical protein
MVHYPIRERLIKVSSPERKYGILDKDDGFFVIYGRLIFIAISFARLAQLDRATAF